MENDLPTQGDGSYAAASDEDVYRATVQAASRLINAAVCEVAIADGNELAVRASSSSDSETPRRSYPLRTSIPGVAYLTQQHCLIDDRSNTRSAAQPLQDSVDDSISYRSMLCLPLDDHGVFVAKAPKPGALTPADEEIAERLIATAEAALGRIETDDPRTQGDALSGDEKSRLDVIAQILSHDLKSPLTVAHGSLDMAKSTGEAEHFNRAAVALSRIEELVDSVVVLARTGQLVTSVEPIDLAWALKKTQTVLPMEDATMEIVDSATIIASEEVLRHLLENLVQNSIDHAGPAVTIRVGLIPDGFYVEDDGPGISPDEREAVFRRGHTSEIGHNGLGLSIAKELADAHGWSIAVTDGSKGGARFELTGVQFTEE